MDKKTNDDGFSINVYGSGNFIAKEMTFSGTVNAGGVKEEDGGLSKEEIANALAGVQEYMWANSANAVIFCALRDYHGYADNMSQFERDWISFSEGKRLSWGCPDGTLRAAFKNNPYMKLPISKWRENGVSDRVMLLLEKFEEKLT